MIAPAAEGLAHQMLQALQREMDNVWEEVKPFAQTEVKSFVENLLLIEQLQQQGRINATQAQLYLEIQKNAMRVVFLTIEGLGILAVEKALQAAWDVIRAPVQAALGWTLV